MNRAEVEKILREKIGNCLRVTFTDDVIWNVDVSSVDEEGFVHSGPNGTQSEHYWTRFESVQLVEMIVGENFH